ncbi:hypothetical protein [Leptospira stimsonii]|uniref:Lipoprotein n=1 Tax=Leptospira stimsonii TaxID=2202203 RepID=A0A8B3CLZ3_9LEPT|nr:hypothetical protein [Leptospira stimsonii]RHX83287.1 hypothetical protein DLM78_22560 [Leptospira stimsonii]
MKIFDRINLGNILPILIVLSIITFSNCATFTYYPEFPSKYEMVMNFKPPEKRKSLKVSIKRVIISDGEEITLSSGGNKRAETNFIEHLESTKAFSRITTENIESDLQCDIVWEEALGSSIALNMLSGITLLVVPGSMESTVNLSMNFKNKKGTIIKEYRRSVTFQTWIGWIMIPFTPFYFIFSEVEKGNREIIQSIIQEAMKDKIM